MHDIMSIYRSFPVYMIRLWLACDNNSNSIDDFWSKLLNICCILWTVRVWDAPHIRTQKFAAFFSPQTQKFLEARTQ